MRVFDSIEQLVGGTPLVRLGRYAPDVCLYAKAEYMNPAGSIKDRAALGMIADFEARSLLQPGGTIIEPTSGNTGIALAAFAAVKGYKMILVMPDTMSPERIRLAGAYGAQVVLTPGAQGMAGAVERAETLQKTIAGSVIAGQFENPANPASHEATTGPEIWRDTDGKVRLLFAGIGTGGTITGIGRYLKAQDPSIRVIGIEPASSPLLTEGKAGPHGLQGIGANFVPKAFDRSAADEVVTVTDADAFAAMRQLARREGLFVGITSGAAAFAAARYMRENGLEDALGVCILPDTGARYLSTGLFDGDKA